MIIWLIIYLINQSKYTKQSISLLCQKSPAQRTGKATRKCYFPTHLESEVKFEFVFYFLIFLWDMYTKLII